MTFSSTIVPKVFRLSSTYIQHISSLVMTFLRNYVKDRITTVEMKLYDQTPIPKAQVIVYF